ncbi:hypothetical protein ACWGF3_24510 [Streptomyces xanthophaeus]|uniref:Uncharacterized protein n=1 Tax=Streptomyces xanthophaeus TaxID=67385 RepID=A0A919H5D3_9ACTN|nr:hypothetical protein [Streptomyces xanthophaeus]GHI87759.1 hypothetical protein Sxan_51230 [Streptomyces xanthophaeus]
MSSANRKEAQVRQLMEGPLPVVPADLASGAAARGDRLLRRRRALRRLGWAVLFAAAVAFTVWAALTQPWVTPSSSISPPLEGW